MRIFKNHFLAALLFILFPVLAMAQQIGTFHPFSTKTEAGKTTIIFSRSSPYTRLEWSTLRAGEYFSEIQSLDLSRNRFIKVEDMAVFWLMGKDTLSVIVLSPEKNMPSAVFVNGYNAISRRHLERSLWLYDSLVPKIRAYYDELLFSEEYY